MNRIIIAGSSHHNTLSVVRAIGLTSNKVELFIIGERTSYISRSKYVTTAEYFNNVSDMIEHLISHVEEYSEASIISCSDVVSQALDSSPDTIWNNLNFFRCKGKGLLTQLMDKSIQVKYANSIGLNTPVSIKLLTGSHYNNIPLPCILKPSESYKGGKRIIICNNIDEFENALSQFPPEVEILAQEYIHKQYEIVIPGFANIDNIIVPGIIRKFRDVSGATTYSRVLPFDETTKILEEQVKKFIAEIEYEGLFGFEFIFDGNQFYFIELNLRNDATCYSFIPAGINLPAMCISKLGDIKNYNVIDSYDSIVEFNDFSFVLRHEISIRNWFNALKNSKCKYYYTREDIKPFISALFFWINNWTFKRIFK